MLRRVCSGRHYAARGHKRYHAAFVADTTSSRSNTFTARSSLFDETCPGTRDAGLKVQKTRQAFIWRSLPMGWSWSPVIAQACAWSFLAFRDNQETALIPDAAFSEHMGLPRWVATEAGPGFATVYYDNFLIVTADRSQAIAWQARIDRNRLSTQAGGVNVEIKGATGKSQLIFAALCSGRPIFRVDQGRTLLEMARVVGGLGRGGWPGLEPTDLYFSGRWEAPEHIFLLEMRAAVGVLKKFRSVMAVGRATLVVDNAAVYYALQNGMTASRRGQEIMDTLQEHDLDDIDMVLVPSQQNPADCPSRDNTSDLAARQERLFLALLEHRKGKQLSPPDRKAFTGSWSGVRHAAAPDEK